MSASIITNIDDSKHPNSTVSARVWDLYVDNSIFDINKQSGAPNQVLSKNDSNELVWSAPSQDSSIVTRRNEFNFGIDGTITTIPFDVLIFSNNSSLVYNGANNTFDNLSSTDRVYQVFFSGSISVNDANENGFRLFFYRQKGGVPTALSVLDATGSGVNTKLNMSTSFIITDVDANDEMYIAVQRNVGASMTSFIDLNYQVTYKLIQA